MEQRIISDQANSRCHILHSTTMTSDQPVANRISVNSAEQDDQIDSVTVFQADRAEVKRRVKLDLKQGQNHVDIERLPTCINEDSIRVDGTGTAIIFDVVYHSPYRQQPSAPTSDDPNQQAVAESLRVLESLRKEREVAQEQSNFLTAYANTLDSKNVNVEDVGRFLDMFGPRQVALAKRIQELDVEVREAEEAYNEAQAKIYADRRGADRGTKITVTVLAEVDGEAELMLTYVVSNARWTPLYDVRASIAKSPDATSTIALHYRASITQMTGENWSDVALTLSTASPQLGSNVPNLSSWRIGFPAPPPPPAGGALPAFRAASLNRDRHQQQQHSIPLRAQATGMALPKMAIRSARVVDAGVLSATFGISGRSDIPSDEGSHKVVIAVLDLTAELEWVCVPREQESVFLRCKVLNASEFTLLPGEASVFMDDNFVSKSRIEVPVSRIPFTDAVSHISRSARRSKRLIQDLVRHRLCPSRDLPPASHSQPDNQPVQLLLGQRLQAIGYCALSAYYCPQFTPKHRLRVTYPRPCSRQHGCSDQGQCAVSWWTRPCCG
ncbi:hypothetical protein FS749_013341 [Ceratobasidium sp. UAMH 11750]|nr:hypothetical protein FS749_013341 [Ceratobasidium sp. UAMH 11750]